MDGSSSRAAGRNLAARSAAGGEVSTASWVASFALHGLVAVVAFAVPYAVLRGKVERRRPVVLALAPPERSPISFEDPEPKLEVTPAELADEDPEVVPVEMPLEPSPFPPDPKFEPLELDPFGFLRLPAETFVIPEAVDAVDEDPVVLAAEEVVTPTPIAEPVGEESAETSPVLLEYESPKLDYPVRARRRHEEGSVLCRITVAASGRVAKVVVVRSSGHESLDRAALDGITSWRFRPGTRAGQAVAMDLLHRVTFREE